MLLTDEQWFLIAPFFSPPSPYDRGRPSLDQTDPGYNRRVLDAILYKLREQVPWYDLPAIFPPWPTCYRRYRLWRKDGTLDNVLGFLFLHLRYVGDLDIGQALRSGRLAIFRQGHRPVLYALDPALQDTWQLDVARLFLAFAVQKGKDRDAVQPRPEADHGPNGRLK
jgi:hypothetical protein